MYHSRKQISRASTALLRKELDHFCMQHKEWYCRALKRRISLEKLPEAIWRRKASRGNRLRCFWVALDILRKEPVLKKHYKDAREGAIVGRAAGGELVSIHVRKESDARKDTRWFFVSCFYKEK